MLRDLDETIKNLLTKAGGFDPNQVDISFKIPNREWSEKEVQRPTLNCYLFDIHERRALREEGWRPENRKESRRQPPLFFELTYLITAWTRNIEDEHMLLWEVLETLVRFPTLNDPNVVLERKPREDMRTNRWAEAAAALPPNTDTRPRLTECLHGSLAEYSWPITAQIAQLEGVLKSPGEFWTALENHLKPSLSYVVTLGLDRQAMRAGPPVLATGLSLRLPESLAAIGFYLSDIVTVPAGASVAGVPVQFESPGGSATIKTDADGRIDTSALKAGRYLASAQLASGTLQRMVLVRDKHSGQSAPFRERITDQDGVALANIAVEVEGTSMRASTDEHGWFELNLAPGRYTLRIQLPGWAQRREISIRSPAYQLYLHYGGVPPASISKAETP